MRKEEQLLAYLKGACPGRQHAAPGRRETEEHLARMIRGLEAARQGLLRGMEEKLLSDVGGGCHR